MVATLQLTPSSLQPYLQPIITEMEERSSCPSCYRSRDIEQEPLNIAEKMWLVNVVVLYGETAFKLAEEYDVKSASINKWVYSMSIVRRTCWDLVLGILMIWVIQWGKMSKLPWKKIVMTPRPRSQNVHLTIHMDPFVNGSTLRMVLFTLVRDRFTIEDYLIH